MREEASAGATRRSYDAIAGPYAKQFRSALDDRPLDRAMLTGFADMVRRLDDYPQVLDLGSGPGVVTAFLHRAGVAIRGLDLSSKMVEAARRNHPDIEFHIGDMRALESPDAGLAGVVAWYSIIHVATDDLPKLFNDFHRILVDNGYVLLAFQVGDAVLHLNEAFGSPVTLDFQRLQPNEVIRLLNKAGFDIVAQLIQPPDPTSIAEQIPQALLMAQKRPRVDERRMNADCPASHA